MTPEEFVQFKIDVETFVRTLYLLAVIKEIAENEARNRAEQETTR